MVIDLMIVGLLAWGGIIGWRRGAYRSLLDCASVGSAIAVVLFSVPLVRDVLIDGSWAWPLRKWLRERLQTVPAGMGFSNPGFGAADRLYHLLIVGTGALAVWIGMQMILQVFQTVLREPVGSVGSRIAGTLMGMAMAGIFSVYVVQCLGLLSWLRGFEALDFSLRQSFLVWSVMNWIAR